MILALSKHQLVKKVSGPRNALAIRREAASGWGWHATLPPFMSVIYKRRDQEGLLDSAPSSVMEAILQLNCTVEGHPHSLHVERDGSVMITPSSQGSATAACLNCCKGKQAPVEVPAASIVGATQEAGKAVRLWHMPPPRAGLEKPVRRLCRTPPLRLPSERDAAAVVAHVRAAACWGGRAEPKRLLVIINPASGPGRGPSIYRKQVKPVLEAAGLICTEVLTTHRRHATEIVEAIQPGDYDVVVSIGGDGTMYEVVQGLLNRPDWDAMRRMPLVQVPCGSGNALAASTGLWDAPTAAHAIIKGDIQALDIVSVLQPPGRRYYSFLSINFGLITNLDIGTEHLRWMGGTRFVVGALQQILLGKSHVARVAFLEAPGDGTSASAAAGAAGAAAAGAAAAGLPAAEGGPSDTAAMPAGAAGGSAAAGKGQHVGGPEFDWQRVEAAAAVGPPLEHTAEFHLLADHATLDDLTLPPGWQWLPTAAVQLFTASNLPRLDMNFLLVPDARLDSGHINLVYTPAERMTRRKGFELLTASEKGRHMHLVEQHRVVALALEPVTSGTWLVVDGEEVPFQTIFLEVHPSLCQVIVAAS